MTHLEAMRVDREIRTQYSDESDACYAARMLWYDFKDAVFYENRYFVKHELLDMLAEYISENILDIEAGHIYYRARIIDDSCIDEHMIRKCYCIPEGEEPPVKYVGKANPFKGLTKEASFVPPKGVKVGEGRANPRYVKYLYVAESPTTAMYEVRPFMFDAVNIAKVRVNEPLRIVDIAVDLDLSSNKGATKEMWVMGMIQGAFSKPTNNTDDYLPTQVIAEYVRSLGYDGIRFNSSLHYGGVNLTIFNYEKCEAVSSQDFRIEEMKITARAAIASANYQGDLSYIKDNEPKYLDFEKFKAMDEFLKTSENS